MASSKILGIISVVFKLVLMFFIFGAICSGAFGIFGNPNWHSMESSRKAAGEASVLDMEYSFLGLSSIAFIFCLISSLVNCCGLFGEGNKALNFTDICLCAIAGFFLLVAGVLIIIAAEQYCATISIDSGRRIRQPRRRFRPRGIVSESGCGDSEEECELERCRNRAMYAPKIIAGAVSIVLCLAFVVPMGLACFGIMRTSPKEPQNAANLMENQAQDAGAYGGPQVNPSYVASPQANPSYAAPPPDYQPQASDGSYGLKASLASRPQTSPSQNAPMAYPQYAPPPEGN